MGFEVVSANPHMVWAPIVDSDTCYVGQLVDCQGAEGVAPLGAAAGAADTTAQVVPFGVVVGTNNKTPSFDSTYKADKIVEATPHGTTTEFTGVEGPLRVGGHTEAMVKIALITPETIIRGKIFNAAYGTAPTVGTVTTGSTTGKAATGTSALCDVAGVAVLGTVYFRSGANQGIYRITDDTSTTALTWDKATPYDVAVNDTLVRINGLRPVGTSYMQTDSESTYIDCSAALTADYWVIEVVRLDLSTAGSEYVDFRFGMDHFCLKRT